MGMECYFGLEGHCEHEQLGVNGCIHKQDCEAAFERNSNSMNTISYSPST